MPVARTKPELTARELQVLKLLCSEKTNGQIGDKLGISVETVKFHRNNLYKKLGIHRPLGLYKYALREGIVKPPRPGV